MIPHGVSFVYPCLCRLRSSFFSGSSCAPYRLGLSRNPMPAFRIIKGEEAIHSKERWFQLAPPARGGIHWKDGRSAKELARAWFPTSSASPQVPAELDSLLRTVPDLYPLIWERGVPEHEVPLDTFQGGKRNQDLMLVGHAGNCSVVVSIEAKADETFDKTLEEWIKSGAENPRSNISARAALLLAGLIGKTGADNPDLLGIRQQLLTGTAGALIEAKREGADVAVFVVHEFVANQCTKPKWLERNQCDFEKFVRLLLKAPDANIHQGILFGPIEVPGGEFIPSDIPLYVGKVRRSLDDSCEHPLL